MQSLNQLICCVCLWNWQTWLNFAIIILSRITLLRWLTLLLGFLIVTLTVLLFWIYFYLLALVFFYNGFPSIGKFWSCSCLSFHWLFIIFTKGCSVSSHCLWLFSGWLGRSSWSFGRCSMGRYVKSSKYHWLVWQSTTINRITTDNQFKNQT